MKHFFSQRKNPQKEKIEKFEHILSNIKISPREDFTKELERKIFFAEQNSKKSVSETKKVFFSKKLFYFAIPLAFVLAFILKEPDFVSAKLGHIVTVSKNLFLRKEFGGDPIPFTMKKPENVSISLVYPTYEQRGEYGSITQYFGDNHHGVDFSTKEDDPIFAAADGIVTYEGCGKEDKWNGGYGCTIILDHGEGIETLYSHNKTNLVGPGDEVKQGQTIATMGITGYGTGPHVHFEVRVNDISVNPLFFLPKKTTTTKDSP